MTDTPTSAPAEIRFCPRCGAPLATRRVGDKARRACSACNYIHFTDPKVGVGVLVVQNRRILLVRRAVHPQIGAWSVPAGFLDQGEDPQLTAVRETREETGLDVRITSLVDVYYNAPQPQGGASIFILYRAELIGGQLKAGDDADRVAFFELDALPRLAFASTQDAIARVSREFTAATSNP